MRKIAFCSLKGGTSKTVSSLAVSTAWARAGHRTLLVDVDPQGHAGLGIGLDPSELARTLYDVLIEGRDAQGCIQATQIKNLDILPSNLRLALGQELLLNKRFRESILQKALRNIERSYSYCVLDCGPSLGVLSINAIYSADYVVIPCPMGRYGLEGISSLIDVLEDVKNGRDCFGILLTQLDKRTTRTNEWVLEQLQPYKKHLLKTVIHKSEALNQAVISQQSIFDFDRNSQGAKDYMKLRKELEKIKWLS